MQVRDEHAVELAGVDRVGPAAAQVRDAAAQHGVGQQPRAGRLEQHGGVPEPGDRHPARARLVTSAMAGASHVRGQRSSPVTDDAPTLTTLWRRTLADGERTTIYAVRHRGRAGPRPALPASRGGSTSGAASTASARRSSAASSSATRTGALGEVWIAGRGWRSSPWPSRTAQRRACVLSDGSGVRLAALASAPEPPRGDLVQAGPLLVAGGAIVFAEGEDREGFSRGRRPVRLRHHRRAPSARGARGSRATS